MKRKVVKHGPSSLIVSLPSAWARKYGVKQGDELDVNAEGSRLVIDSNNEKVMPEATLDISKLSPKLIKGFLVGTYQKGYDKINILFEDKKQFIPIQKKMPELLGFEIMEKTNKSCVIQSIAKRLDIDFKMSLRKAFLIVKDMANTTLELFEKGDNEELKHLYLRDYEVNRLCYFCLRNINKQAYIGSHKGTYSLYYLIEILKDLGDSLKTVSRALLKLRKDKDVISIFKKINDYLELAYEFFYNPEQEKIISALKLDQETLRLIKNATKHAIKNKKLQKIYVLYLLHDIVQLIYHFPSRRVVDTLKQE